MRQTLAYSRRFVILPSSLLQFGALTWPGDLDLAPDAMHEEISRTGRFVA